MRTKYHDHAKAVYAYIKEKQLVTRSELNLRFAVNSDSRKHEMLSTVLKSMIFFNHLDRHHIPDTTSVYFWPKGADSPYPAQTGTVHGVVDRDYLSLPDALASTHRGESLNITTSVPADTQEEKEGANVEDAPDQKPKLCEAPKLQSTDELAIIIEEAKTLLSEGVTFDVMFARLLAKVPFMSGDDAVRMFRSHTDSRVIAARLSFMARTGKIRRGRHLTEYPKTPDVFYCPAFHPPEGYGLVKEFALPARKTKRSVGIPAAPPSSHILNFAFNAARGSETEDEKENEVAAEKASFHPTSGLSPVPKSEVTAERILEYPDVTSPEWIFSKRSLTMVRPSGQHVVLNVEEVKALLEFMQVFKLEELQQHYAKEAENARQSTH